MGNRASQSAAYATVPDEKQSPPPLAPAPMLADDGPWATFVRRLFGKPRATAETAAADVDYVKLHSVNQTLKQRLAETLQKKTEYLNRYRAAHASKDPYDKTLAGKFRQQYQMLGERAVQIQTTLLTLEQMFETINGQQITAMTVRALQMGNAALQARLKELDTETIATTQAEMESLMAEIQDQAEQMTALNDSMVTGSRLIIDEKAFDQYLDNGDEVEKVKEVVVAEEKIPRPAGTGRATPPTPSIEAVPLI